EAIVFLGVSVVIIYAPTELLIRPYIVSLKSSLHPFLLMLSFIGGGLMGGIGGFFLAPVAVGAICAAYDVYVKQSVSPDKYPESQ
ncbi:MAG: AI-2E family transporter, partial [Methermicoccaceae archaeon]